MLIIPSSDSQGWKFYSHGKVVEHKADNSDDIEVIPIEKQPFQSGAMVSDIVTVQSSGVNAKGTAYSASSNTSKSITAKWKGDGTNRVTSPDVRRDDDVMIWTYADTEKYYWTCNDSDLSRRRNEHVQHRYSGTTDESTTALDDTNSYSKTISPKLGLIDLSTSKANGEKTTHKLQMNSKDGIAVFGDGDGNFIQIEYEGKITLINKDGTYLISDGKMMKLHADDSITLETKDQIFTNDTTEITANKSYTLNTQNYAVAAKTQGQVTAPIYAINAATSYSVTSAMINLGAPIINFGTFGAITGGGFSMGGPSTNITSAETHLNSPTTNITGEVTLSTAAAESIANQVRPYI